MALETSSNPTANPGSGAFAPDPRQHPLVTAIPERLPLPRPSGGYQFALGVVAVVMMLLPLIYLALIAGIVWAVRWHLTNNFDIVTATGVRGRGAMFMILVFLAPAIIGAAVVVVMLKPLLAWPRRRERPQPVAPTDEPVLFAAVERLCRALGSPIPHQIHFANDANASASFQSLGDLLSNRLTLVIGLPLAAGLPARSLLGVLAHEFGHFNQYWAMRLGWIIHSINHWFTRVALERDAWDEWLEQTSQSTDIRLGWVLYLARGGIWLTRRILRGLRWIGVLVSRRLSRQMEYNADACEAALVGSVGFADTMRSIVELSAASNFAEQELNHLARERRLVDNFPRLIAAQARYLPEPVREQLAKADQQAEMSWDDTHPPNRLRVAQALLLNQPCRYAPEGPATDLFVDFDSRCRAMAREIYSDNLNRPVTAEELIPVDQAIAEMAQSAANDQASRDYVGGAMKALDQLDFDEPTLSTTQSAAELWSELLSARREQTQYLGPFRESSQRESELIEEWQVTELLSIAMLSNQPTSPFQPASAPRRLRNHEATLKHLEGVLEQWIAASVRGRPFRRAWSTRLRTALQLLDTPETAALLPETPRLRGQRDRLWPALVALSDTYHDRVRIQIEASNLGYLFSRAMEQGFNALFGECIGASRARLMKTLGGAWERLSQAGYPEPFDPAPEHLAAFCLPGIRDQEDPLQVYNASHRLTSTAQIVWRKSLGRAIQIASLVEQAWETSAPAATQTSPAGEASRSPLPGTGQPPRDSTRSGSAPG
jgi:Zn-dependent protease with chaperone function